MNISGLYQSDICEVNEVLLAILGGSVQNSVSVRAWKGREKSLPFLLDVG